MEEINSHFLKFYSTDKQMIMIFIEKKFASAIADYIKMPTFAIEKRVSPIRPAPFESSRA